MTARASALARGKHTYSRIAVLIVATDIIARPPAAHASVIRLNMDDSEPGPYQWPGQITVRGG